MNAESTVGTVEWTQRTGGRLEPAERRRLVGDLARVHGQQCRRPVQRARPPRPWPALVRSAGTVRAPDSPLTRAAQDAATRVLPATLLNHSYRTYAFGRALGELEGIDVDTELLFAGALLHDTGLVHRRRCGRLHPRLRAPGPRRRRQGRTLDCRTETRCRPPSPCTTAPRVTLDDGAVAYLLSAGAGVDVAACAVGAAAQHRRRRRDHPREGFKAYFTRAWAAEAARVPQGRAKLLRRYGAFTAAIALAPFEE